jgi:hypothetical protein
MLHGIKLVNKVEAIADYFDDKMQLHAIFLVELFSSWAPSDPQRLLWKQLLAVSMLLLVLTVLNVCASGFPLLWMPWVGFFSYKNPINRNLHFLIRKILCICTRSREP